MQDGFFLHLLLLPIKIILIKEVHIFEINLSNKQRKDLKKIVIKSSIRLWDLTTERKIGKWNRQYSFRIISVTDD